VFGPREAVARARCIVAEAELALVSRDLGWPAKALNEARATLEAHGDRLNAAHARNIEARRPLLIGSLEEAERVLGEVDPGPLPPLLTAARELVIAGIAIRRLQMKPARDALRRAEHAARQGGIAALMAEVEVACLVLRQPAGRLIAGTQCIIMPMLQPISLLHWSSATKHPAMGWEQEPARSADIPQRFVARTRRIV
jgi:hypothetical protein